MHLCALSVIGMLCCPVFAMRVRRRRRRSWLPVEALCAGLGSDGSRSLADAEGRELILFGGKVSVNKWRARKREKGDDLLLSECLVMVVPERGCDKVPA